MVSSTGVEGHHKVEVVSLLIDIVHDLVTQGAQLIDTY